jgi:putative CocE/NonD family hydrolase
MRIGICIVMVALGCGCALADDVRARFDVRIPMRDGVELSADMWLPAADGRYPAILIRTPYLKNESAREGAIWAGRGYVLVVQDVRGRGDSGGGFSFFATDDRDGYDTVEWIAAQSWSNGKVGMKGASYMATVQWLAAREQPPHLVCIAAHSPGGDWFNSRPYHGGALVGSWALMWLNVVSGRIMQAGNMAGLPWEQIYRHRPLQTMDDAMGRDMAMWGDWLAHDTFDDYWKRITLAPEDFARIRIPALLITGWFDHLLPAALSYWDGLRTHGKALDRQHLIVGPWLHDPDGRFKLGELEFPRDTAFEKLIPYEAFFDHHLKGTAPKFDQPRARVYDTGSKQWRDLDKYPPPAAVERRLYLHSRGKANTLSGDGTLTWSAPPGEEPVDRYTYDPRNPVPSFTGKFGFEPPTYVGLDQRSIEARDDVLVYTSDAFADAVTVAGRMRLHLYAATDARDTDFTAKIADVYPDGRAVHLGPLPAAFIRARLRNGMERAEPVTPGKVERYRIELSDMVHTFPAGHRIRLEVSSSAYPYIFPNSNTGNPAATDTESRAARQTIHHAGGSASYLELPILR